MGPPLRLRGGSLGDLWFDVWRFFFFVRRRNPGDIMAYRGHAAPVISTGLRKSVPGLVFW